MQTREQQQRRIPMVRKDYSIAIKQAKAEKIDFSKSVFELTTSEKNFLHDLAKTHKYKKSSTSPYSLGSAFFIRICAIERMK